MDEVAEGPVMNGPAGSVDSGRAAKPAWAWVAAILLLALGVRFGAVISSGQYVYRTYSERYESDRVGTALATSGSFSDPFISPTGPTAHLSPGYPVLLGAVLRVFRNGARRELAKEFLGCLITAVQYALLVLIAPVLGMPAEVGCVAGLLGACLPLDWTVETAGDSEATLVGALLILLVAATANAWRNQAVTARLGFSHGVMWGAGGLFSPAVLAVEAGLTVSALVFCRKGLPDRLRFVACLALGTLIALAPWGIRNWTQLGYPVLTRSNLGLELYVSNNDLAASSLFQNMLSMDTYHPTFNSSVAEQVRKQGEIAFNRRYFRLAVGWIKAKPARFAELTLERVGGFWFGWYDDSAIRLSLLGLVTLGGFAGLTMLWWKDRAAAWVLWTVELTFPLIYYLVQTSPRYRYPIYWISLLGSVYAVSRLLRPRSGGTRTVAG